jgi:7,8-dihydropterin-6-yl-methyl-4-(beta-D-ribofuranosyl)aminobenzene 5'-phosphate synthase
MILCARWAIPWSYEDYDDIKNNLVLVKTTMELAPGINVCGEIPFSAEFEGIPSGFYFGDRTPDMMKDEQMLVIENEKGLNIFLGCSHPG